MESRGKRKRLVNIRLRSYDLGDHNNKKKLKGNTYCLFVLICLTILMFISGFGPGYGPGFGPGYGPGFGSGYGPGFGPGYG
jgi:hypothetical protein